MTKAIPRWLWFATICGSLALAAASPPVIGVARSRGAILINHASLPGSATILDGSSVETTDNPSNVSLKNGERVLLASSSSAIVHQDRLVLDRGAAELNGLALYRIEAGTFRISASSSGARIHVVLEQSDRVNIAAAGGSADVRNSQGMLVATVLSGTALQVAAADPSLVQLTGIDRAVGGRFLLTDEISKVSVELRGSNLNNLVGKRVHVTGSVDSGATPAAGASQVVTVTQATEMHADRVGGPAAAAAVSKGLSTTAISIMGGAAVTAGVVGGLYAAGAIGGTSPSVSR